MENACIREGAMIERIGRMALGGWFSMPPDQRRIISRFILLVGVLAIGPHSTAGIVLVWAIMDWLLIE